jgi:hypothetical protein
MDVQQLAHRRVRPAELALSIAGQGEFDFSAVAKAALAASAVSATTAVSAGPRRLRTQGISAMAEAPANRMRPRARPMRGARTMLHVALNTMLTDRIAVHGAPLDRLPIAPRLADVLTRALVLEHPRTLIFTPCAIALLHIDALPFVPKLPALRARCAIDLPPLVKTKGAAVSQALATHFCPIA